jgi:hypothetical protein
MYLQISQSRSRLLGLEGGVETKSRFLDLDWDFSIVEKSFLKLSRFSWQSRPTVCQCQEKSRPPGLVSKLKITLTSPNLHKYFSQFGKYCVSSHYLLLKQTWFCAISVFFSDCDPDRAVFVDVISVKKQNSVLENMFQ